MSNRARRGALPPVWRFGLLMIGVAVVFSVLFATMPALAGSADPTPYSVDSTGITSPIAFANGGHVNLQADAPHTDLHFQAKCVVLTATNPECAGALHVAAQFIGAHFIPWSAFGLAGTFCVSWAQLAQYSEHFGEGGQAAVCVTSSSPAPTGVPSSSPSPSATPSATTSPTPTSSPSPTATPEPPSTSTSEPTPSGSPSPSQSFTLLPAPRVTEPPIIHSTTCGTGCAQLAATGLSHSQLVVVSLASAAAILIGTLLLMIRARNAAKTAAILPRRNRETFTNVT